MLTDRDFQIWCHDRDREVWEIGIIEYAWAKWAKQPKE